MLKMGSREIGRKSDVFLAFDTLGIGTIADFFHFEGGLPHAIEWLKGLVIDGAMEFAVDLIMRAEMPSKPFALDVSRDCSMMRISSSVHRMSNGYSLFASGVMVVTGGVDPLKQLAK